MISLHKSKGMSLVELMIAMVIGLIIVGIAVSAVQGQKISTGFTTAMIGAQIQGRFALDTMTSAVRSAGYIGCATTSNTIPKVPATANATATLPNQYTPILGFSVTQGGWQPSQPEGYNNYTMPTSGYASPVIGSHALLLEGGLGKGAALYNSSLSGNYLDLTERPLGLEKGNMALVSDCNKAEAFFIESTTNAAAGIWRIRTKQPLDSFYEVRSEFPDATRAIPYNKAVYFIGDSARTTPNGDPIRSLFQHSHPFASNPPEELVEGVESMVVIFRQRKSDGTIVELPSGHADIKPSETIGVILSLLVSVPAHDKSGQTPFNYYLAGIQAGTDPNNGPSYNDDKRIRRVYEQHIDVRNFMETQQ